MKSEKISFLKRIYLAITDFRVYPYTQKESLMTAFGYFFQLVLMVAIIIGAIFTSDLLEKSPIAFSAYQEYMPDFTVENGLLTTSENTRQEINRDYYLMVCSDDTYSELKELEIQEENSHKYYVIVLADATLIGVRTEEGIQELAAVPYDTSMNFNKEQFAKEWETLQESVPVRLLIWVAMTIGIFGVLILIKMWTVLMYILSAYIINLMFGLKLKWTSYLKVALYVCTLPFLLELIAMIVVGGVSETVNFISILLSCVYIFYALRAIKLDSLIMGGKGKNAEEKMREVLENSKKELENQLREMERAKEEKCENSEEEKNIIEELGKELKEKEENLLKAQKEYDEALEKLVKKAKEKDEEDQK